MKTAAPARKLKPKDILLARTSAKVPDQKKGREHPSIDLQINGKHIPAGSYVAKIVGDCLELIAEGHPVTVMPIDDEIGTQEAANLLKVSRPYLVKLLDAHVIPSRKVGVQRRVKTEDVLFYKKKEKAARMKVLMKLAADDQHLNLGE